MKLLICDDDPLFAERIEKMAAPFFAAEGIEAEIRVCTSAAEAEALPELEQYQLAFLDVDLDGASGIALGRILKQKNPGVMLVYISAFYTLSSQGIRLVVSAVGDLLMGGLIPLPFMPEGVQKVLELTPFAAMQNLPLRAYTGQLAGEELLWTAVLQVFWLAVLILLGRLWMKRALRRVVIQGG